MTPEEILKQFVIDHRLKGNKPISESVKAIVAALNKRPKLKQQLGPFFMYRAVQETLYDVRHDEASIIQAAPNRCNRDPMVIDATAHVHVKTFLRVWEMPDGRALYDWTGDQCCEQVVPLASQAATLLHKSAFYARLGIKAGSKRIGEVFSSEEAAAMWNRIHNQLEGVA